MASRFKEAELSRIRRVKAGQRKNLVDRSELGRPGSGFDGWLDRLPNILAARDLRLLVSRLKEASQNQRPCIWILGGHVIKTGLAPYLIRMMERGYATALVMNGSVAIHDSELALFGATSEDVGENLSDGSFGMIAETPAFFAEAIKAGADEDLGLGECLGQALTTAPHAEASVLASAARLGLPATVHVALGADILHQHPELHTPDLGEMSLRDFRILSKVLSDLDEGSVVVNLGSAVMGPEVFLKALTVARNLGAKASGFTAVNMDMIQHYRPRRNILERPIKEGGRSIALTGHHEIMLPLLSALLD